MVAQLWMRVNGGNWNNSGSANPDTLTGGLSLASIAGPYFPFVSGNISGTGPISGIINNGVTPSLVAVGAVTAGTFSGAFPNTQAVWATVVAPASGNITAVEISVVSGATGTVLGALYATSSGNPTTLLATSTAVSLTTPGILSIPIPSTAVVAGTTYAIGFMFTSPSAIIFNTANSGGGNIYQTGISAAVFPATASVTGSFGYSMWAGMSYGSKFLYTQPTTAQNWGSVLWNPADKSNFVLSNSNQYAGLITGTTNGFVRGTISQSTAVPGLFYVEFQATQSSGVATYAGIANAGAVFTGGQALAGTARLDQAGNLTVNGGASLVTGLTWTNNSIIGLALSTGAPVAGLPSGMFFGAD
jgi:hypothetical protein